MANPWSIMESLNKWASYLREHIDRLKLKPEERREYEDSRKLDYSQLSIHFYSGRKSNIIVWNFQLLSLKKMGTISSCINVFPV